MTDEFITPDMGRDVARAAALGDIVERLKCRLEENKKCNWPNAINARMNQEWSDAEYDKIVPYAQGILAKEISYHRACSELRPVLGRSFESIRTKLKATVNALKYIALNLSKPEARR